LAREPTHGNSALTPAYLSLQNFFLMITTCNQWPFYLVMNSIQVATIELEVHAAHYLRTFLEKTPQALIPSFVMVNCWSFEETAAFSTDSNTEAGATVRPPCRK
jgi:hypothetical protein